MTEMHSATMRCPCGATMSVASYLASVVDKRILVFGAAHEDCHQAVRLLGPARIEPGPGPVLGR